jgi:hypothetical protein
MTPGFVDARLQSTEWLIWIDWLCGAVPRSDELALLGTTGTCVSRDPIPAVPRNRIEAGCNVG